MNRLWAIVFLSFIVTNLSEARNEKELSSAVVVGSVYCDTCFQQSFSKASHFISGALVAVECADTKSRPSFKKEVKTNEHGEFKVDLPFSVSKHVNKIRRCSVKLISSSEPHCAVASTATSSSIHLKSRLEGTHIFSAGFFTFRPLQQPELCDQKPTNVQSSKEVNAYKSSISQDLPALPPLPKLPPFIFPPIFPSPPPFVIPPIFFPPPPPFKFPPIFPVPLPSPCINCPFPPIFPAPPPSPWINFPFPPLPALTPSSAPPPPVFQFPFPPFPFKPVPGYPGVPPPPTSSKKNSP